MGSYSKVEKSELLVSSHSLNLFLVLEKIAIVKAYGKRKIVVKVGNGSQIYLWHDNWHPLGPLLLSFPTKIITSFSNFWHAKLDSILYNGLWCWPEGRRKIEEVEQLIKDIPSNFISCSQADVFRWKSNSSGIFSVKSTVNLLRVHGSVYPWTGVRSMVQKIHPSFCFYEFCG
ncbi:hypothetical protein ACH5RR_028963 [Cinchona calisaya]|uniref:Uncharacterized protein n=1 Tax=Cinchona calisaya TaxID=153742 RepID=A0ABD2YQA4_9GENT